jgi:hypothetical protein
VEQVQQARPTASGRDRQGAQGRHDIVLCVELIDPREIAGEIDQLVKNPELARHMGENHRLAPVKDFILSRIRTGIRQ